MTAAHIPYRVADDDGIRHVGTLGSQPSHGLVNDRRLLVDPGSGVAPAMTSKASDRPKCSICAIAMGACFDVAVAIGIPARWRSHSSSGTPSNGSGSK